jgi:lysozyme
MMKTTSEEGKRLIRYFEGPGAMNLSRTRHLPYICPAGKPTIGYGEVISKAEFNRLKAAGGITKEEAKTRFEKLLPERERAVTRLITVPLTQKQFDALVSFTFNLGIGALETSTLRKLLNKKMYVNAAGQFGRWVHGGGKVLPGLVKRRKEEERLFNGEDFTLDIPLTTKLMQAILPKKP